MEVTLNRHEILMGATVGVMRRLTSLKLQKTNKVHSRDFGWHTDIEAACAEVAVAKYLNIFWDGSINTFKDPDVGEFQVRHTQIETGCLIIRNKDLDNEKYILVIGTSPTYKICGYIQGRDGKKDEFIKDPNNNYPAFFVPQNRLIPIDNLRKKQPQSFVNKNTNPAIPPSFGNQAAIPPSFDFDLDP